MKKCHVILLLTLMSISGNAFSQTGDALCSDLFRNVWSYYGYGNDQVLFSENYNFDGEYVKKGKTYRRLHFERSFLDSSHGSGGSSTQIDFYASPDYQVSGDVGIRESDGRVFVDRDEYMALLADDSYWSWEGNRNFIPYEQTADGELVLYDFNKQAGDYYCYMDGFGVVYVTRLDVIETSDGSHRKIQTLSNGYRIVEGIGCVNSPGMWLCYLNPVVSPCDKGVLRQMTTGGEDASDIYSWVDYEKWAQGFIHTLSGHITDQDKNPVAGAKVTLQGISASYEAVTDADGLYAIQAEEEMSPLRVSVAADGYIAVNDLNGLTDMKADMTLDFTLLNRVTYPAGERCTLVLPFTPDASAGRYYRLYEQVGNDVVFVREPEPKACVPYVFFPEKDYMVDVAGLNLTQPVTLLRTPGTSFMGRFYSHNVGAVSTNTSVIVLDESSRWLTDWFVDGLHAVLFANYPYIWKPEIICLETPAETPPCQSLLKDGRSWYYSSDEGDFREYIDGTEEAYGETWYRVYIEKPLGSEAKFEKLMRQQGCRVYSLNQYNKLWLMADYGIAEGEPFPFQTDATPYHLSLSGCDSIKSQGREYRRLTFNQVDMENRTTKLDDVTWVDGISFGCGIYRSCIETNLVAIEGEMDIDMSSRLKSCYDGDVCIYDSDDVTIANGIRSSYSSSVQSSATYDLQGRRLQGRPAKGLYIENGRKRVVKMGIR